ncbi:MAG: restriction endonuclease subunit S [Thermoanaerobaculia bacterium]|nr:restriction endonuclease subunit S [Thermoanaerobaculia bacterium]
MASDLRETTLGSLLSFANGRSSPSRADEYQHPVYGSNGIIGYANEANAEPRTIVIGRVGSYCGSLHMSKHRCWVTDNAIRAIALDNNDPRFLFYLLGTLNLNNSRAGSGQPLLNQEILGRIPATVPGPAEQRAIAHILGTLDDKIELNRRMSETLEAMARVLFKSWFMDFDPVRAKAEGRDTGLPRHVGDLFPDSFEDSELGEIPKGWRVVALGGCCRRVAMGPFGSDIKTDNFVDFGVPVVRGRNLTKGFVDDEFVFIPESKADELRNANAFPGDIVITHRGTLGQVGMIPNSSRFPRYVVSQSQMLITVNPHLASPQYVFNYLRSITGQQALLANTSQTGVPAIARPTTSVKAIRLPLPPLAVLASFDRTTASFAEREVEVTNQSRTLSSLRDTLLPKLISGELRVKDAERFIGKTS